MLPKICEFAATNQRLPTTVRDAVERLVRLADNDPVAVHECQRELDQLLRILQGQRAALEATPGEISLTA
jgi:hypothetical protein